MNKCKRLIAMVICAALICSVLPMTVFAEEVTKEIDAELVLDVPSVASFVENDKVVYAFTPEVKENYAFTSSNNGDPYATLYDSEWNELAYDDDGGTGRAFAFTYVLEAGNIYYLKIGTYSENEEYEITVSVVHDYVVDEVLEEDTCTTDGLVRKKCIYCDDSYEETTEAYGHYVCAWYVIEEATCTENGTKQGECSNCGETITEIIEAGHDYVHYEVVEEGTCISEGLARYTCECGAYYEESTGLGNHNYVSEIVKAPTCVEMGLEREICSICEKSYEWKLYEIDHDFSENECVMCGAKVYDLTLTQPVNISLENKESVVFVRFTANEDRYYRFYSEGSGDPYVNLLDSNQDKIDFDDDSIGTSNFDFNYLLDAGEMCYLEIKTYEIPASFEVSVELQHHYTSETIKEATCTEEGLMRYTCDYCGDTYDSTITKMNHDYQEEVILEKTCTQDGIVRYTCNDCGDTYDETVNASHNWDYTDYKESTCTELGWNLKVCEDCGDEETEYKDEYGHSYRGTTITESSCTQEGLKRYTCEYCGDSYDKKVVMHYESASYAEPKCLECGSDIYGYCWGNARWDIHEGEIVFSPCENADEYISHDIAQYYASSYTTAIVQSGIGKVGEIPQWLGKSDFEYSAKLKKVVLADDVTIIDDKAFNCAIQLREVNLPEALVEIGEYSFFSCTSLYKLVMPENIAKIGSTAFGRSSIHEIYFTGDAPNFAEDSMKNAYCVIYYPADNETWTPDVMQNYGGKVTWKPYNLNAVEAPTVKVSNLTSTGKIKISWEKVEGAESYEVYRSTDNKTWKLLKEVTGTSLTNTSTTAGTKYYYKVRAVADGITSEFSEVELRTCDLARPEVEISNVASTGKIKLTWDKVDGAKSYKVYRSTDNKTWSLLKEVTGTSLTNTSTTAGKKYYYKVMAIHSNSAANSAYSEVVYRTCDLARPEVEISNVESTGKIKLTWDKVEGAKSYKVYRSTDNKTWSLLKEVTGTSLTNTSTTAGKKYYYKVMAVHSTSAANSAYSEVVYRTCDLARPEAEVSLNSKGKPVVSWDKVSGASKYKVYIYDSEGSLVKTSTTTSTKLTHSSAVKGKTYNYRVEAIHSNSAANSAKSVKVSIKSK